MDQEHRSDRFTAIEDQYAGYTVYDQADQKIGKVDDLFVDENDQPEYIGVKMGLLGTSSTLIPFELASVEDERQAIVVATDKDTAKSGPAFDDDHEITPEFESEVHSYYGLQRTGSTEERGTYAEYSSSETTSGSAGPGMAMGDTESGEVVGHAEDDEGGAQTSGSDLDDRDELR